MEAGRTTPPTPPVGQLTVHVTELGKPDLGTVELLAALQITAQRRGWRIQLAGATPRLRELLCMAGLEMLLGCTALAPPRTAAPAHGLPGGSNGPPYAYSRSSGWQDPFGPWRPPSSTQQGECVMVSLRRRHGEGR